MEVSVRVLQVRQDLPEAVQLRGDVHEAVTLFLDYLDNLVGEYLEVLTKPPSSCLNLSQVLVLHIIVCTSAVIDQVCHTELFEQLATIK